MSNKDSLLTFDGIPITWSNRAMEKDVMHWVYIPPSPAAYIEYQKRDLKSKKAFLKAVMGKK
jgi:hypothetical protein